MERIRSKTLCHALDSLEATFKQSGCVGLILDDTAFDGLLAEISRLPGHEHRERERSFQWRGLLVTRCTDQRADVAGRLC